MSKNLTPMLFAHGFRLVKLKHDSLQARWRYNPATWRQQLHTVDSLNTTSLLSHYTPTVLYRLTDYRPQACGCWSRREVHWCWVLHCSRVVERIDCSYRQVCVQAIMKAHESNRTDYYAFLDQIHYRSSRQTRFGINRHLRQRIAPV